MSDPIANPKVQLVGLANRRKWHLNFDTSGIDIFSCTVSAQIAPDAEETYSVTGRYCPSKALAEQSASAKMMEMSVRHQLQIRSLRLMVQSSRDWVTALNTLCKRMGYPFPDYKITEHGRGYRGSVKFEVRGRKFEDERTSSDYKALKQELARRVLDRLTMFEPLEPVSELKRRIAAEQEEEIVIFDQ